jgi:hypothetical protein
MNAFLAPIANKKLAGTLNTLAAKPVHVREHNAGFQKCGT